MILDLVQERGGADPVYHLVAPPGSGKTIVGLELIRRFGRPAVIFAPTTTIQRQWREKIEMFGGDAPWIARHMSLDARDLRDINVLTYQVLSTPGENLEFVERIATERWVDDLLVCDRVQSEEEARARIATLESANPSAFRRELSKRYRRVKQEILREGSLDGRQFLHPNARNLIERIVALGAGTVVLDECHHLLDYWAYILRELIQAIPDVHVIGLTATLPDPANRNEYENYYSLLGDVDFQVPTPAVVKEGNLAPYRDLVYFCHPSAPEQSYLEEIQRHFERAVWQVSHTDAFRDWLWTLLFPDLEESENPAAILESFEAAFKREPLLCIAAVKYLLEQGVSLPLNVPIVEEMWEPLEVDDWLTLMENYALRALKVSPAAEHQALYRDLCDALLPFGITVSERGIRRQRSPSDLVLALSESKCQAVVQILRAESAAMEGTLRALVLTDYEKMNARTRRLQGVLDPDAGSAVRIFRHVAAHPATAVLAPILVTGNVVLIHARMQSLLEEGIRRWVEDHQARFSWEWRATPNDQILRLAGAGPDWSSRTYVALVTALFEQGITRCLVGTRGIFGEGWDTLRLNTLLDLTSVTASTSVQQIRGRTVRLDPSWPRKVAHNWDVICVSPDFDKGDADLGRFVSRHEHTWGLAIRAEPEDRGARIRHAMGDRRLPESAQPETLDGEPASRLHRMDGRIVRGVAHVDLDLAVDLATHRFDQVPFRTYTQHMLDAVWDRDQVYELWAVGEPYDNRSYSATHVDAREIRFRTARTVGDSLGAMTRWLLISLGAVGATAWLGGAVIMPWAEMQALTALGAGVVALTGGAALTATTVNAWSMARLFRRTFLELPADSILLDMGQALLVALQGAGVVDVGLSLDCVRVVETEAGRFEVLLEPASEGARQQGGLDSADEEPSERDAEQFARAFQQMMGPLGNTRYLIERDGSSLRNPLHRSLWFAVRKTLHLDQDLKAYHRVPDVLASRRERAEALAREWRRFVGGGRLVYTRTLEGRRILLQARAQRRESLPQMGFQIWR